jgi:hypothetical protein
MPNFDSPNHAGIRYLRRDSRVELNCPGNTCVRDWLTPRGINMAPVAAPIILSEVLRVSLKIYSFDDHATAILTFKYADKSTITLSMT